MSGLILLLLVPCTLAGSIKSGVPWHDSDGNLIDAHGAGILEHDNRYYWYGSRRTIIAPGTQMDGGIALYSSSDLYSWDFESLVLPVFNCTNSTANTDYPPPSCASGNGLDLERPKVVQCGGPGGKFVMWVRGTGYGNSPQLLAVLESDSPTGPFAFVSNRSGSDDPFVTVAQGIQNYPPGYQYADATLFQDPMTYKTYVFWRTRMTKGLDGATGFRGMELTADCRGVKPESDLRITATPNREGPAMFFHNQSYYLYTSGTMGWSPTAMYVYKAPTPLGNFSVTKQDDHYWHAYSKGLAYNSSIHWNGTWTISNGFILVGQPYGNHSHDGNSGSDGVSTTFAEAKSSCAKADKCAGFTFIDYDQAPAQTKLLRVTFKSEVRLWPEKEVGLQPPPIPVPGQPGNAARGQPGAWAFNSQSTYILPNPAFSRKQDLPNAPDNAKIAPFIYMGDRWNYTNTHGTSTATYVWLPLFIDPAAPGSVKIVWRDEWQLDDESMYPF